jgi:hypothetical protein
MPQTLDDLYNSTMNEQSKGSLDSIWNSVQDEQKTGNNAITSPPILSQLVRGIMRNTPLEQAKTKEYLSDNPDKIPPPNPGENMFDYQKRIDLLNKDRETSIANKGTVSQFEDPISAGLAISGAINPLNTLKTVGKFMAVDKASNMVPFLNPNNIQNPNLKDVADIAKFGVEGKLATSKWIPEKPLDQQIYDVANKGIQQGIRPSVSGKNTLFKKDSFDQGAVNAIKDIVSNKDSLNITDYNGNKLDNPLSGGIKGFAQAIQQRMDTLVKTWQDLANQSQDKGVIISSNPYIDKLNSLLDENGIDAKGNPILGKNGQIFQTEHPVDYAKVKAIRDGLQLRGNLTPGEALDKIQEWNADLKPGYNNGFKYGSTRALNVVKGITENLREDLDKSITDSTGENFQPLRTLWGSYKSLVGDVVKRSIVQGRANPMGIWNFLDTVGNAELLHGAMSGNLPLMGKGALMKIGKWNIERTNNPDNIINNMFSKVDKLMAQIPIKPQVGSSQNPQVLKQGSANYINPLNPLNQALGLPAPGNITHANIPVSSFGQGEGFSFKPSGLKEQMSPGVKKLTPNIEETSLAQRTTPKEVPKEVIDKAKEEINNQWYKGITSQFNPIAKKALPIALGGIVGSGVFGNQAQANQNIDISKINKIESGTKDTPYGLGDAVGDYDKNGNPTAFGINQVHLGTLSDFNKATGKNYQKEDLFSVSKNNEVADWYYNKEAPRLLKNYGIPDTIENRIAIYNWGPGNFSKAYKSGKPMPKTTIAYIGKYKNL